MRRVVRVLAALAIGIGGAAVSPGSVAAICRTLPARDAAAVTATPVVFVGTVAFTAGSTGYLTVDEIWRGPDLPWLTTVYSGSTDPGVIMEDAAQWTLGIRYLVFASVEPGGKLLAGACGPTSYYQSSLDALRPADARQRYGTLLGGAVVVLVAGAVAGAVAFVVRRVRRWPARSRPLIRTH